MTETAEQMTVRLYPDGDVTITSLKGNRHYIQTEGSETIESASRCNGCGGAFANRGYCTNCGSPA
jgi:rRNA maturation endonuclease Nob1